MEAGRLEPGVLARFGRFLLLWNELTSLATTDGYRMAERDVLARAVQARRGALAELLGVVADDAVSEARLRRMAVRHGLDPDQTYRSVAIAASREGDQYVRRLGIGEEELEEMRTDRGHLLGSSAPGAEGVGGGIDRPPCYPSRATSWSSLVTPGLRWDGYRPSSMVSSATSWQPRSPGDRLARDPRGSPHRGPGWRSVHGPSLASVRSPSCMPISWPLRAPPSGSADAAGYRTLSYLALERLLLADRYLADATMRRELGPLLADERLGDELIVTLQAYFDAGQNVTAAARRLHLATRTVTYRLERYRVPARPHARRRERSAPLDRIDGAQLAVGRSRNRATLTAPGAVALVGQCWRLLRPACRVTS